MAFNWSAELETGNIQIDEEHKKLIKAINDLLAACGQGKGRQEITNTVDFLVDYTKTHFSHEEKLQIQNRYPEYSAHKAWHEGYVAQISQLAKRLKDEGATIILVGEVNMKASILVTHIKTQDVKLAKFIKEQNK